MEFEFSKNYADFSPCQEVSLNRIKQNGEYYLMCKCTQSGDFPGILRTVNLPQLTTYTLEVTGYANNNRVHLHVADLHGSKLYDKFVCLKVNTSSTVKLKFIAKTSQVRIGVLMGADSFVATPQDYFRVSRIRLTYETNKNLLGGANSSDLKITRVFETVPDLEREIQDPLRTNKSPMEVGEYAILRNTEKHHDDLYILSRRGLQYVCRIGEGLPSFFGESLHNHPGRVMPVYHRPEEAQRDLINDPDKFYYPKDSTYVWSNMRNEIRGDIYLYLDSQGYVRWLRNSKEEVKKEEVKKEDVKKEVKEELVSLLDL